MEAKRDYYAGNRPSGDIKKTEKWDKKNADAVACIRLSLSDGQILQFANQTNAKLLWTTIHNAFAGLAEDRAIDAGEKLRNIKMMDNEMASEYISHARGMSIKCVPGLNISEQQLVYNVVRGLHNKFNQIIHKILNTQREKKLNEILEILKEKERERCRRGTTAETVTPRRAHTQPKTATRKITRKDAMYEYAEK